MSSRSRLALALICALWPLAAAAQDRAPGDFYATATSADIPQENFIAGETLENAAAPVAVDDATLQQLLNPDPSSVRGKTPRMPAQRSYEADWSRVDRKNGKQDYRVNKPLPTPWDARWDAKVGADLSTPPQPMTTYEPGGPLPGATTDRGSGRAWANVKVPDVATVEMRAEPSLDGGKVGTSVQRSFPLGSRYSVTVQNDFSFTGTYPTLTGAPANAASSQIWGSEKTLKFNILSTGTTLAAGTVNASNDPVTHNKLSVEQKIYGPLNVTGAVTDVGQTNSSKSLTAGFKFNW